MKIYFSFRNSICCIKICKFLKTVIMVLVILLLSATILTQISKIKMYVFEISLLEKQWLNFFQNNYSLPLGGLQSIF